MFWRAVQRGDFQLPTTGFFADRFWTEFLNLGFRDNEILQDIFDYSVELIRKSSDGERNRWPYFYTKVVQHMLITGRDAEAGIWESKLIRWHPPSYTELSLMFRNVTFLRGYKGDLKRIYERNDFRNLYSDIVPILCKQEDFESAYNWHKLLISRGDLPWKISLVEPMIQFFAVFYPIKAAKITKGLVDAGVSFAENISSTLKDNTKISREMMNIIHGDTTGFQPKEYNDGLGARWFATRWISLDVALNAVQALGIQEIGPLSLQAIALREPDPESVTRRLDQLRDLDISIGKSMFSRALDQFAREGQGDFLRGLLRSDQHPDELDDHKLQERLLTSYYRKQDWVQYNLTLAIRLVGSENAQVKSQNIILRNFLRVKNSSAIIKMLRKMRVEGTPVKSYTIHHILSWALGPRLPGRRPTTKHGRNNQPIDDLRNVIIALRDIMESGTFIPITFWREIIKRLGMLWRLDYLTELCIYLASWYGPVNGANSAVQLSYRRTQQYHVPAQVPTSHPLHPLAILFPVKLQKAIVQWAFINAFRIGASPSSYGIFSDSRRPIDHITDGIKLLRRLNQYGVHINLISVKKAIMDRLIQLYSPGQSNRRYNRVAQRRNHHTLEEMAAVIDEALGERTLLSTPELQEVILLRGSKRLIKRAGIERRADRNKSLRNPHLSSYAGVIQHGKKGSTAAHEYLQYSPLKSSASAKSI